MKHRLPAFPGEADAAAENKGNSLVPMLTGSRSKLSKRNDLRIPASDFSHESNYPSGVPAHGHMSSGRTTRRSSREAGLTSNHSSRTPSKGRLQLGRQGSARSGGTPKSEVMVAGTGGD